jgi:mannose-6-phosphate isomerase-like protein (cupin superfamily)
MSLTEPRLQNITKFFKHLGNFDWNQITPADYKPTDDSWKGVSRRVFVGETGESTRFHLRYFEVEKGGFTTLEQHEHEHVVFVVRGRGLAVVGCKELPMSFGDVLYVSPSDPHQFRNDDGDEPFGFLCIVNAERDRPRLADMAFCPICE